MKYNDLDLTKLIPFGIPLNSDNHVAYRNYINEFFLKGFENWYKSVQDYASTCSAPNSLKACLEANDDTIRRLIEEFDINYYTSNDHEINAEFLFKLATTPLGTPEILDALTKYVFNTNEVTGEAVYQEPYSSHKYEINAEGDITNAGTDDIIQRFIDGLNQIIPASEQWIGFNFTQIENININVTKPIVQSLEGLITCKVEAPSVNLSLWLGIVRSKTPAVSAIRTITGKGLSEAKAIVDNVYDTGTPYLVKTYTDQTSANNDLLTLQGANNENDAFLTEGETPHVGIVYARSASYQTSNANTAAGTTIALYGRGGSTTLFAEEGTYEILGIYQASGTKVEYSNVDLYKRTSDGRLVLTNNRASAISWCYITYKIS